MQDETSGAGGVALAMAPSTGLHMHPVKLHNPRNPGQFADCTIDPVIHQEGEGGFTRAIAYTVRNKKGVWTLVRNKIHPERMFVINTKGMVGNLRGWEWFYEAPCGLVVPYG